MKLVPYARTQGGLATVFGRPDWLAPTIAILVLEAVAWLALGTSGLVAAGIVLISTLLFSRWCLRKIGGFTGDTLGAACEIAEIVPALVCASWGWRA
jgi:adenosylcobinamide-GDP ribazoletransferase